MAGGGKRSATPVSQLTGRSVFAFPKKMASPPPQPKTRAIFEGLEKMNCNPRQKSFEQALLDFFGNVVEAEDKFVGLLARGIGRE